MENVHQASRMPTLIESGRRPSSERRILRPGDHRRRGTVMIFVLGILTLLALVGIAMIASTRSDQKRFANEAKATTATASIDSVVQVIQQILRRDIWGEMPSSGYDRPLANDDNVSIGASLGSATGYYLIRENNEPFDAPGKADRWLASTVPYVMVTENGDPDQDVPTQYNSAVTEDKVLVWPSVTYLGTDIRQGGPLTPNTFIWHTNSRKYGPGVLQLQTYDESVLDNVPVMQTPPPPNLSIPPADYFLGTMVTGSTTNVTIAKARRLWNSINWAGVPGIPPPWIANGLKPQFPYFDTNIDGVPDLYDADGDGIPDSPISFKIPAATPDSDDSEDLYAVVRIVDHASMLNANVAWSWVNNDSFPIGPLFNELTADRQRRGRRVTDLLFDPLLHAGDLGRLYPANFTRPGTLVHFRTSNVVPTTALNDPLLYDLNVVRRDLAGGRSGDFGYFLYGTSDEASLRHRGTLAPHALADYNKGAPATPDPYATIDTALPWTLLETREIVGGSYASDYSRWNRYNSDYTAFLNSGINSSYEGFDQTNPYRLGWRTLWQEDQSNALRRPMLTTLSHDVRPLPDNSRFLLLGPPPPVNLLDPTGQNGLPITMQWPNAYDSTTGTTYYLPVDINLTGANPLAAPSVKQAYIGQVAAAMYTALEAPGVKKYAPFAGDFDLTEIEKQRMAWQFALNMADFRDSDGVPTEIEFTDPSVPAEPLRMFGLEKQPFFTEAYAQLNANAEAGVFPPDSDDTWFEAVELFVPASWSVDVSKLYFRNGPATQMVPLSGFTGVLSGLPPVLDGGAYTNPSDGSKSVTGGTFFVFCNSLTSTALIDTSTFFTNAAFDIPNTGDGIVELVYSNTNDQNDPTLHVLDVISPSRSGTLLPGDGLVSGAGAFGKRPDQPAVLSEDEKWQFDLVRSTSGWRFTTAWHYYGATRVTSSPSIQPNATAPAKVSLGLPQLNLSELDSLPQSPWPARSTYDENSMMSGEVPNGFGSNAEFEAFDSVGELSRMLLVGPTRGASLTALPFSYITLPNLAGARSATEHLAALLGHLSDPPTGGRIDFHVDWTNQLFSFFTVMDYAHDFVDNDGDNLVDEPTEALDVLYRFAGRLNINTAPMSVLRTVPFMSLMPSSPEYLQYAAGLTLPVTADKRADFLANPNLFWDLASAIVAYRENRVDQSGAPLVGVPVRLTDGFGNQQVVAIAKADDHAPFQTIADLARLNHDTMNDASAGGHSSMFRIDRYESDGTLGLDNHRVQTGPTAPWQSVGVDNPFSPDFRVRDGNTVQAIDYEPIKFDLTSDFGAGGLRGRDIYLARWANLLTTRSDVFTAYIALIDENGKYVQRSEVTFDRSGCFREVRAPGVPNFPILPDVVLRSDSDYYDDTQ